MQRKRKETFLGGATAQAAEWAHLSQFHVHAHLVCKKHAQKKPDNQHTMTTILGLPDLAPEIFRKRAVIEGYPAQPITSEQIKEYLEMLSDVCGMKTLAAPTMHRSDTFGWAGWIHWETSGAHFYAWDQPRLFFSVDIYTCKQFSIEKAAEFTKEYFRASRIVYRDI